MQAFPDKETRLFIPGPVGRLQAIATPPKQSGDERSPTSANDTENVAIVCHPHSLMGGTMNNKVVHTLARMHRDQGHPVIRFNFRGVEQSEGEYDAGMGESDDLLAVIEWATQCFPRARVWLAGFSFGSFVAARTVELALEQGYPVEHLLLVAPAVENYDFDRLMDFPVPLVMVYGDQDEVVDAAQIQAWFDLVHTPKQSACLAGAGHFFHGRLTDLKSTVETLCF